MSEFLPVFTRASKLLRMAADQAMSRHGVRVGQNLLLEVLWDGDGLTPGELADRLRVATPTVVKSVTRMAAAGLLERRRDPSDARLVRIHLTDLGRAAQVPIAAARNELERRATANLTADERRHLLSALAKIVREFDDGTAPSEPDAGWA